MSIYNLEERGVAERDEIMHQLDIENGDISILPSISTSTSNEGVYGYDRSPEMLKKGLEAQAKAHEDFMRTIYPVAQ